MNQSKDLPTARQMIPHFLASLRKIGREATVREVEEAVAMELGLTAGQLAIPHDDSRTEFQYRLAWSRSYAKKEGLAISHRRNRWELPASKPGA